MIALAGFLILSVVITLTGCLLQPEAWPVFVINCFSQGILFMLAQRRNKWLLSPFVLLFYLYFWANVVRAFAVLVPESIAPHHVFLGKIPLEAHIYGSLVFFVGTASVAIGSLVPIRGILPREDGFIMRRLWFTNSSLYVCLGAIMFILALILANSTAAEIFSAKRIYESSSGIQSRFGPLRLLLGIFVVYTFIYFYWLVLSRGSRAKALGIALVMVLVSVVISLRVFTLILVLPIVLIALHRMRLKTIAWAIVLAPFIIYTMGYTAAVRGPDGGDVGVPSFWKTLETLWYASTVSAHFGGFVSTGLSTYLIEPYQNPTLGSTIFFDPITQFVPRYWFPEKPEELGGRLRLSQQQANVLPENIAGGVPPGLFAEFWLNFRWLGVAVFGFLTGTLLGSIHKRMSSTKSTRYAALLAVISVIVVLFGFGGHVARVTRFCVQMGIGIILMGYLVRIRVIKSPSSSITIPGRTS